MQFDSTYREYLNRLSESDFSGDIATDLATRITMATDNSIYQVIPMGVCFPKKQHDIVIMMQLAALEAFHPVKFSARGGGTGTNGQSLTAGIVIDCSRYMTRILEVNAEKNVVRVEPGVVLDQLNESVRHYHLFFAPSVSPSSQATLGGMFSTDACGKGSCHYGQTSDHVISATVVLANGEMAKTNDPENATIQKIVKTIDPLLMQHKKAITQKFSNLPRHLTGYNLGKTIEKDQLDLNYLLSGSEGTLAVVTELTLKLTPLPTDTVLVIIKYDSFDAALRHAHTLLPFCPTAIETLDEHILSASSHSFIPSSDVITKAINILELSDPKKLVGIRAALDKIGGNYFVTTSKEEIASLWDLRKKSVGILANLPGVRQPIPFVEDTAVPPLHLADYIAEFRAILTSHGLTYGMFGHADAGCIHVRPALDMKNVNDAALVPMITQQVYALIKKYNGLMWSEHGRGFRTPLANDFFGQDLYHLLRQIKTAFDPYNQLNPGKIASSLTTEQPLVSITGPFRGEQDAKISPQLQEAYDRAIRCNGNGACFHYANDALMCPSYHATADRIHSPKGRSALLREWLKKESSKDFSLQVYQAMQGCLGCKACATRCPVHVDIPEYKSLFLQEFYKKFRRPFKDYCIAYVEFLLPYLMKFPRLSNFLISPSLLKKFGLFDLPVFSTISLKKELKKRKVNTYSANWFSVSSDRNVALLIDPFIAAFKPQWAIDTVALLFSLGYQVHILPIRPNGKPMHAKGFLKSFERLAKKNNAFYSRLKMPIIGIDPGLTLCFRDEYKKILKDKLNFTAQLLPEFLYSEQENWKQLVKKSYDQKIYYFFTHCIEKSLVLPIIKYWLTVFEHFGITVKPIKTSCCGMAGSFGYEKENQAMSKKVFALSWEKPLSAMSTNDIALVTGFSCGCQVERFSDIQPQYPASVLRVYADP